MMLCEFCGGETVNKKVRKIHWFQERLYIVDDVEAEVCRESRGLPGMWRALLSRHNVGCYRPVVRIEWPCCQRTTPGAGCWDAGLSTGMVGSKIGGFKIGRF